MEPGCHTETRRSRPNDTSTTASHDVFASRTRTRGREMATEDTAFAVSLADASDVGIGPLEARHLRSRLFRNAANTSRVTSTHWHIAWANGLGWGFDGMDGAILALVAPLLMKE